MGRKQAGGGTEEESLALRKTRGGRYCSQLSVDEKEDRFWNDAGLSGLHSNYVVKEAIYMVD